MAPATSHHAVDGHGLARRPALRRRAGRKLSRCAWGGLAATRIDLYRRLGDGLSDWIWQDVHPAGSAQAEHRIVIPLPAGASSLPLLITATATDATSYGSEWLRRSDCLFSDDFERIR